MGLARLLVALYLPKKVPELVIHGEGIVTKMTNNPHLPNPTPDLATVGLHLQALRDAAAAARTRSTLAVAARKDVKLVVLKDKDMHGLKACVQSAADANPALAETIITSAGMGVIQWGITQKRTFGAEMGTVSGQVLLYAPRRRQDIAFSWQMAPKPELWLDLPQTVQASTFAEGLTPLTVYSFRYRALTREGLEDWSRSVSLLVI